ncbi:MAG: hypothetical protein H5U00_06545 [Clostridia bacterium]|nr:hypothetical protein [Clostridia bacterium]
MEGKRAVRSSVRGAGWWVLAGAAYGLASFLPLTYELIREEMWSGLQAFGGPVLVAGIAALLPAVWALFLTAPLAQTGGLLYLAVPLAAVLGGAAGYLLKTLVGMARGRRV